MREVDYSFDVVEKFICMQDLAPTYIRELWAAMMIAWLNISLKVLESVPCQFTALQETTQY